MEVHFKVDLRDKNLSGNKVDTKKIVKKIKHFILSFWDCAGLDIIIKEVK